MSKTVMRQPDAGRSKCRVLQL